MHLNEILLVTIALLIAGVDASSRRSSSDRAKTTASVVHPTSTQRFLRGDANTNVEERLSLFRFTKAVKPVKKENLQKVLLSHLQKPPKAVKKVRFELTGTATLKGKSPDLAFTFLNLDKAGDDLFASPDFKLWAKHISETYNDDPVTLMMAPIVSRFDDERLQRMLEAAKKAGSSDDISTRLQNKIEDWIETKLNGFESLKVLELDKVGDHLLTDPRFKLWVDYMTKAYEGNRQQEMLIALYQKYKGKELARMLAAARMVKSMKGIAEELQDLQMAFWIDNKLSVNDCFKFFELDKGMDKILNNQDVGIFITYATKVYSKKPIAENLPINAFREEYGDLPLAKMLEMAKNKDATRESAKKMQLALYRQWANDHIEPYYYQKLFRQKSENSIEVKILNDYRKVYNSIRKPV